MNLYLNQTVRVKVGNESTQILQIENYVKQGCVLSPLFFSLYLEAIFESLEVSSLVNSSTSGKSCVMRNTTYSKSSYRENRMPKNSRTQTNILAAKFTSLTILFTVLYSSLHLGYVTKY